MWTDLNNEKQSENLAKIDSFYLVLDDQNYERVLFHNYILLKYQIKYSTGNNQVISQTFNRLKKHIQKHNLVSFLNKRLIENMIHYYKSVGEHEQLLQLIKTVESWKRLLPPTDSNELLTSLYYDTLQFNKAIRIYKIMYKESNQPLRRSSLLNNIGLAYTQLKNYKEAKVNLEYSLDIMNRFLADSSLVQSKQAKNSKIFNWHSLIDFRNLIIENLEFVSKTKHSKQDILRNLLNHSAAFFELYKVIDIDSYYDIAFMYSNLEQFEKSNIYLDSLDDNMRRSSRYPNLEFKIKQLRVFNNLKLGKIELALNDLSLDTISDGQTSKILALTNYHQDNFDKEKNSIISSNQKMKRIGGGIFLLIVSIISYYTFLIWKKKKRQQKKAEYRQQQISYEKEKAALMLKEADHRIMNSIQLVSNLASLEKMKNESEFDIQAFQLKMMSIAEIHKIMHQENQAEFLSTENYFNEIINLLKNSLSFPGVISINVTEKQALISDDLKNMGLIVVELIINSIKHSKSELDLLSIEIDINITGINKWTIHYTDNGSFNYQNFINNSNYNTSMVALLIQSLRAEYHIKNHSCFNIEIIRK